jgi:hypothetical protein
MMKKNKRHKRQRDCHNCEAAVYIGEGDYICDGNPTTLIIADWIPTSDFAMCRRRYVCPKCENAEHKTGAKFCKICGLKIG